MHLEPAQPTVKNPPERFAGDVWLDLIAAPHGESQRVTVASVRFAPCARTAWHSHANGQTLHITEGVALLGTRDGTVLRATPGQTVYTPPGEEHWHGAAPDRFMQHLAIIDNGGDPSGGTTWLEHVTDEEYRRAAEA
ncbi:(R)-mandelonitrile lyase [Microbacterium sp. No. 7]|uniref:(R)-mandelonitrile lyase n=1 Tax=Microbacterium sp. No. 7 TaxID=1714373 RepID=UPI0006CF78C6|nr:cupin domain-containing protein [Microbacterium sp. No. 7]ALJ18671.1 cupin [Microbacterium sp. No. 7]